MKEQKVFIDPASDVVIAWLFSKPENERLLLDFVNGVLEDEGWPLVKSLELKNPISIRDSLIDKYIILDIKAIDETGRYVNIEVQRSGGRDFIQRSLFYWSKTYASQMIKGEDYTSLAPVICINLLDFDLFPDLPELHNCFILKHRHKENFVLSEHLSIHFIELQKYRNRASLSASLGRWLDFFRLEGREESNMSDFLDDEIMKQAHEEYISFTQDAKLRYIYEQREKHRRDVQTSINAARREGIKEAKLEDAENMLKDSMPIEKVAYYTGLSVAEVTTLKEKLEQQ